MKIQQKLDEALKNHQIETDRCIAYLRFRNIITPSQESKCRERMKKFYGEVPEKKDYDFCIYVPVEANLYKECITIHAGVCLIAPEVNS